MWVIVERLRVEAESAAREPPQNIRDLRLAKSVNRMSVHMTLFGKLAKKKPFFKKSLSADSGYYAVIEALWTLEPCGANRQTFSEKAVKPVVGCIFTKR